MASFTIHDRNHNPLTVLSFGEIQIGTVSQIESIWIWNDRDGLLGEEDSEKPHLFAIKGTNQNSDDIDILFNGTEINGFKSMLEARSCGGINTPGQMMTSWHPIGPMEYLILNKMPKNSARNIELRINAPYDSQLFPLNNLTIRISG
jgi:hypothetical protein